MPLWVVTTGRGGGIVVWTLLNWEDVIPNWEDISDMWEG
jgi:hypothetical protein